MKRFIRDLLLFVVIVSAITAIVNFAYIKQHKADTDKFATIPDEIQICNFGSSLGLYGFNYEDVKDNCVCFNFALSAQYLSYDYRLFQYYGDHIVKGTVVFIPVTYFTILGEKDTDTDIFFSLNQRYYSILPPSLIKEYDIYSDIFSRYLPALAADTGDLVITLLGKSKDDFDEEVWQEVAADVSENEEVSAAEFEKYRMENQEEIDALYALIIGCQEKGAVPILISTPFLSVATENRGVIYNHFYSLINQVVKDTGVDYYDYTFDERFADGYSWFCDSIHLNKEGARNFTNILMQEIVYAKGYLNKLS